MTRLVRLGALAVVLTTSAGGCGSSSTPGTPGGGAGTSGSGAGTSGGTPNGGSSGGTTSGGGTFTTTVPGSTPINMLTPAQQMQLCKDLGTYANNAISADATCRLTGIIAATFAMAAGPVSDAQLQATCSAAVSDCKTSPSDPGTSTTMDMCSSSPSDCAATVSEATACWVDSFDAVQASFNQLPTCDKLTAASLSSSGGGLQPTASPTEPSSCKTLDTKCPDNGIWAGVGSAGASP